MTTSSTHAAPWTFRRAFQMFATTSPRRRANRPGITHLLTGREAVARHLFGESVHWGAAAMAGYDGDTRLQGGWLAEADRRIAHAASPDRLVAAHWGYTPADWVSLPAIVQVDKREGFFEAQGLGK